MFVKQRKKEEQIKGDGCLVVLGLTALWDSISV